MFNFYISNTRYLSLLAALKPVYGEIKDSSADFCYLSMAENKFYPLLHVLGTMGSADPDLAETIRAVLFHRVHREDNEVEFRAIHSVLREGLFYRAPGDTLLTSVLERPELAIVSPNPASASSGRTSLIDARGYITYASIVNGVINVEDDVEWDVLYALFADHRTWEIEQFWKEDKVVFKDLFQTVMSSGTEGSPEWMCYDAFPALPGINRFDKMISLEPTGTVSGELIPVHGGYVEEEDLWVPLFQLSAFDRMYNKHVRSVHKGDSL